MISCSHSNLNLVVDCCPGGTSSKELACQCRRHKKCRFDPWVGKIPWRRNGNPFQYSCLENPMDRGAWRATVHRVAKSQTWLKWLSTWVDNKYINLPSKKKKKNWWKAFFLPIQFQFLNSILKSRYNRKIDNTYFSCCLKLFKYI